MLTERQIQLIQGSFPTILDHSDSIVERLFASLFELDEGLRFLFPEDLSGVHRRFGLMLGFVIHRLDDWKEITPRVQNLGVRHHTYGVRPGHYETFGKAFQMTLRACLEITPESELGIAWFALYKEISAIMVSAAQRSVATV